ncbi:MAG: electron transport complex subunit E [Phocaeicola sp.]|nr:electron transport complex subunit E [Phocaeicola sp.]MBR1596013.1 electron transport complex subunit E [Phocaeicola sp.]MBR1719895.1 electron transport complex subunit E [Phocaeicola sp.]
MKNFKILLNGIINENPTFVLLLGMCPTLGTTSSAINGMGMGLATMFVLICSNVVISALKNLIPDMVRIPAYVVIIASFVTLLQMVMQAYVPGLYKTLGIFIPLIVVNCILLGRAEAFASKNKPIPSFFDGLGIGLGFTMALTLLGMVREFLGTGKVFDLPVVPENYGMLIFVLAPGAFIALGYLIAIVNKLRKA